MSLYIIVEQIHPSRVRIQIFWFRFAATVATAGKRSLREGRGPRYVEEFSAILPLLVCVTVILNFAPIIQITS